MNIAILGATGSIGMQTLDVVRNCLPDVKVRVMTGNKNIEALTALVEEFQPDLVWVSPEAAGKIKHKNVVSGEDGLIACAEHPDVDIVINALVGKVGLAPTIAAIKAGKHAALANKESLVTAGSLIMKMAHENGVRITPIDSEHSAIWQCLPQQPHHLASDAESHSYQIEKIILTASGGPFRTWSKEKIEKATAADALKHPNWKMGPKITIDSATLMNKGLELIEAKWLFGQPLSNIEILVHPQSIIHSMVQFKDGVVIAQMGTPDMRLPILYALSAPERVANNFPRLDFLTISALTFEAPDLERFPCLSLAMYAAKIGGTLPTVMNAVNEWAVGQFLQDKIRFYDISELIADAFGSYTNKNVETLEDVQEAEAWVEDYLCQL